MIERIREIAETVRLLLEHAERSPCPGCGDEGPRRARIYTRYRCFEATCRCGAKLEAAYEGGTHG